MSPPPASDDLPEPVAELLASHLTDFDELEALLLLARAPDRWTVAAAAAELRVAAPPLTRTLETLCAQGLVTHDGEGYLFAPRTPALRDACLELRRIHLEDPIRVVRAMGRLALERVRRSAAEAFAGAFRIRKPPGGSSDA